MNKKAILLIVFSAILCIVVGLGVVLIISAKQNLDEDIKSFQVKFQDLALSREKLEKNLKEIKKSKELLEARLKSTKKNASTLSLQLEEEKKGNAKRLVELGGKNRGLKSEITDYQREVKTIRERLELLDSAYLKMEQKLKKTEQQKYESEQKIQELDQKIENLLKEKESTSLGTVVIT